jgi:hypothetical protein
MTLNRQAVPRLDREPWRGIVFDRELENGSLGAGADDLYRLPYEVWQ